MDKIVWLCVSRMKSSKIVAASLQHWPVIHSGCRRTHAERAESIAHAAVAVYLLGHAGDRRGGSTVGFADEAQEQPSQWRATGKQMEALSASRACWR